MPCSGGFGYLGHRLILARADSLFKAVTWRKNEWPGFRLGHVGAQHGSQWLCLQREARPVGMLPDPGRLLQGAARL